MSTNEETTMRHSMFFVTAALSLHLVGCTIEVKTKDAGATPPDTEISDTGTPPPVAEMPDPETPPKAKGWFEPTAEQTWQWQITGALDASYDVEVYDIDVFDNDAATISALHDAGRHVVCYFSAGSYEGWRDDADTYAEADIGKPLEDWPDERWVDIRSQGVRAILSARLDFAAAQGCDAVEPDNVTAFRNDSGFPLTAADQLDFNRWLATEAHARGMGVGLKNDDEQVAELVDAFDFSVAEECHRYDECDAYAPFSQQNKPVFNAEYAESAAEAKTLAVTLCPKARAAGTRTLVLPWDLDDAFRVSCD